MVLLLSYYSCDMVYGQNYKNKVDFHRLVCQKRTNESFRQQLDEDHHISETPFFHIPIDLVR